MDPLARFSEPTRAWFSASFAAPTAAQALGWPAIAEGHHTLIQAPTGSGKTLAAFLHALDDLHGRPQPADPARRTRVVYVSPLKALAHDVERNLRAPLRGIRSAAERLGFPQPPPVETAIRTGDTPPDERRRMLRLPPDILITTPESLYLMLTSRHRETLTAVTTVIIDEVHAIAPHKRGAHLAISLERLADLTEVEPQRIGLSATQRPLEVTARFLGGGIADGDGWQPRPVTIVDATSGGRPDLDLDVRVTVEDMNNPPAPDDLADHATRGSIWPSIHPALLAEIRSERSTIIFANARRLAERVSREVNELAGEPVVRAHHGSISRTQRLEIEDALKRGDLPAVVATSTLELGIDMGSVDRVLLVGSPPSVVSGLQRVGRAGHRVGETSRATIYPTHRADLLAATVIADRMRAGEVEEIHLPANPLDVLAQQVVAIVAMGDRSVDSLHRLVRGAAPFASLPRSLLAATLDMLAGKFPSDLFAELRPRLTWDRATDSLHARPGAHRLAVSNPGTIPDVGLFRVTLPDGTRVGELDEEMVYETRQGDVFVLGTSSWRVTDIGHDRVEVVPAPGAPAARMPFWRGDGPGRPAATGVAVGRFLRRAAETPTDDFRRELIDHLGLDPRAADNLLAHLAEQVAATTHLPTDRTVVVERFLDEIGDWRVVIHSTLGSTVHAPWAMAITHRLRERFGRDVDAVWGDDGISLRFLDTDQVPDTEDLFPSPDELDDILVRHLPDTALFAARFREAAGRSLLLPKRRPGTRTPLWQQRRRSADLLAVARDFPAFPIVLETYREVLRDDFDLQALRTVLTDVHSRRTRVVDVETNAPSPFARSLVFAFTAAFLYDQDAPLAERKAQALTLDRGLLAELLGEGELADLLDPDAITTVELELQWLVPERKARHADSLADLLLDLGPLTLDEVAQRTAPDLDVPASLEALVAARRVIPVRLAGGERLAAVEDASRLRDALGVPPPPGVAESLLEPLPDPLGDVVARHARTHGPFTVAEAASRLGLPPAVVASTLERLGPRVVSGTFRKGTATGEWCDANVLRRIKRRTLATLRGEIEAVPAGRLASFAPRWQGVSTSPPPADMVEVALRLLGCPIPASVLVRDVLADRTTRQPDELDRLLLSGEFLWSGSGSLGRRDGRVVLHTRESRDRLGAPAPGPPPDGDAHDAIVGHLNERGASFFPDLYAAVGGGDPEVVADALWDLVWAGSVTNDSLAPLRHRLDRTRPARRRAPLSSRFGPHTSGRWALVDTSETDATTRATAWAGILLERHGVVTRSVVASEAVPGGFTAVYPVLSRLEETGRARRGYFVEGLGGAQFAAPGAVDRLRERPADELLALAATDPANPYGAALPWPPSATRPARSAGAYVLLGPDGLVGYWDPGGRRLRLFSEVDPGPVADALTRVASRHRRLELESIDDHTVTSHPLATALGARGWRPTPKGLRRP